MSKDAHLESDAGTANDSVEFKLFTEIDMIAHMSTTLFQRALPVGTSVAQFGVLNRLARLSKEETITELAKAFLVSQPTMTSTIKKLVSKGHVALKSGERDRRQKFVSITKAGLAHREAITTSLSPAYPQLQTRVTSEELEETLTVLFRIREMLEDIAYAD
ncbi:MAG: MarR family transcriptional regulator [Pseudomonadota bacterium]